MSIDDLRESTETAPGDISTPDQESGTTARSLGDVDEMEIGRMFGSDEDKGDADGGESEKDSPAEESSDEPGAEPNPAEPDAPVQTYKIKVRGKELDVDLPTLTDFAEKGGDYTLAMQGLRQRERELEAVSILGDRMQHDPEFRAHVMSFGQSPQSAGPDTSPPSDPVERLKWEAVQQAKAEIMREIAPLTQTQEHISQQMVIDRTLSEAKGDPLYPRVAEALKAYVLSQPTETKRRQIYQELDSNPDVYKETYMALRQRVAASKPAAPTQAAPVDPTQPKAVPMPPPAPLARETKAPILEKAGAEVQAPVVTRRKAFQAIAERARSGDIRALGELFG